MGEINAEENSVPESNKIKSVLSDSSVINNLLRVIKILDDEKY